MRLKKHMIKRICSFTAAVLILFAVIFPFTALSVMAADQTFTIRVLKPNADDIYPDGELDKCMRGDFSYFCSMEGITAFTNPRLGKQGSDGHINAADHLWNAILNYYFINAGEITVTYSGDTVHVEVPGINISGSAPYNFYDMDGTTKISITGDAMSFTGNGFYINGDHYSTGELHPDSPITITETYDLWDGQVLEQGTCTATFHDDADLEFSFDLTDSGQMENASLSIEPMNDYVTGGGVAFRDSGRDTLNNESYDVSGEIWPDDLSLYGDCVEMYGFGGVSEGEHDETVSNEAKDTAGEEGYDISEELVEGKKDKGNKSDKPSAFSTALIGAAGALVAGGGGAAAAVAGSNANNSDTQETAEEKKKYRMYVSKNFGNRLVKGGKPVEVLARIAEVDVRSGMERNCPELAGRIMGSGRGLTVADNGVKGAYKSVLISVPKDAPTGDVVLTFTYTGLGGTFRNNLTFHVMEAVAMKFPEDGSGGGWILHDTGALDVIAGDGGVYTLRFYLENAATEAKKFSFSHAADQKFVMESCGPDPGYQFTYLAKIKNLTEPKDEADIFAKPDQCTMSLTAIFEDGSSVSGDVTASVYKEGLSVEVQQVEVRDGCIQVDCYTKEAYYGDDVDPKKIFIYPRLIFTLAVNTESGAQIITDGMRLSFEHLRGESADIDNMVKKYRYELNKVGDNQCFFDQQQELFAYQKKAPWICYLPVTASYGNVDASAELPFALNGAVLPPYSNTEEELKKLLWVMRRYIEDDEERAEWVFYVKEYLGNGKVSGRSLRMMSKQIYEAWYLAASSEGDRWLFWSDCYDQWITTAEWTKYIAVLSFTYVAKVYATMHGGELAGDLTEALVQPAATLFLDSVEELTDATLNQRCFDVEKIKLYEQISSMGDGVAFNMLSGSVMEHPWQIKQNLGLIGAYLAYSCCRNFLQHMAETGEADFPGAIWGAFKDLTLNTIKKAASELFKMWMKSEAFQKEAGKTFSVVAGNMIKEFLAGIGNSEITQKILDEAFGAGVGKLAENMEEGIISYRSVSGEDGIFYTFAYFEWNGKKSYIELDLLLILRLGFTGVPGMLEALFRMLFGSFVGASMPVNFPDDPPAVSKVQLAMYKDRLEKSQRKQDEFFEKMLDKTGLGAVSDGIEKAKDAVLDSIADDIPDDLVQDAEELSRDIVNDMQEITNIPTEDDNILK